MYKYIHTCIYYMYVYIESDTAIQGERTQTIFYIYHIFTTYM